MPQAQYKLTWFPASLPTSYKCIYGISVMPEWVKDTNMTNVNKSHSYLIVSGPDDRVYWFLFVDMGKMYHAEELPRFTKADEDLVVAQHKNDKLTEKFTFRDLYSKKVSSILTPLPEYVFKKWHFSRIMTVGDACHKVCSPWSDPFCWGEKKRKKEKMTQLSVLNCPYLTVQPHQRPRWKQRHRNNSCPHQQPRAHAQGDTGRCSAHRGTNPRLLCSDTGQA